MTTVQPVVELHPLPCWKLSSETSDACWGCLQVFAKCGVLKEDDDRKPKVKVYRDPGTQTPKGDGLVTYLKEPSVSFSP